MFNPVQVGKRTRYSYARIKEVMEMPHLLDIQRKSYEWFLEKGLKEILEDISPISISTGHLKLFFEDPVIGKPKYSLEESKERDGTYSAPIRVKVKLKNDEVGDIKEQEVFMGDFPLMTPTGTFIINGAERVIVSQLVRSPGVYYDETIDQTGKKIFTATVIPNRGAWIELETEAQDKIRVRIDRTRKMPVTYFLRALGFESDESILALFDGNKFIQAELERDDPDVRTEARALEEVYKHIRPNEPTASFESAQQLLNSLFFDPKRYDLASVGRYKIGKKLGLKRRLLGKVVAEDIVDNSTGEILIPADTLVTEEHLKNIKDEEEADIFNLTPDEVHRGYINPIPVKIKTEDDVITMLCAPTLPIHDFRTICIADIISSIGYLLDLMSGVGNTDDIDHLGNRRVRSVGELLQNQFRIGLSRMERIIRDRMTQQDSEIITPQVLINIKPVIAAIKEFFGSSQLSQFMDQNNPLSELTHKRRLSALGPGGLSRERAGFEVRDVHNSHYGRMCPIETPEGPNIGLIGSLSNYARIDQYGFVETPYRKVDAENHRVTNEVRYLTADEEDVLTIAQANEPLDENDWFINPRVTARHREETTIVRRERVDYMDVSPKQVVSIATAMIPFLENDDANRALMGANMQRQAVPLLKTQAPLVGTGMEFKAACDSGVMVLANQSGIVTYVDSSAIKLKPDLGDWYIFPKAYKKLVKFGEKVSEGQRLAENNGVFITARCAGTVTCVESDMIHVQYVSAGNFKGYPIPAQQKARVKEGDYVVRGQALTQSDCTSTCKARISRVTMDKIFYNAVKKFTINRTPAVQIPHSKLKNSRLLIKKGDHLNSNEPLVEYSFFVESPTDGNIFEITPSRITIDCSDYGTLYGFDADGYTTLPSITEGAVVEKGAIIAEKVVDGKIDTKESPADGKVVRDAYGNLGISPFEYCEIPSNVELLVGVGDSVRTGKEIARYVQGAAADVPCKILSTKSDDKDFTIEVEIDQTGEWFIPQGCRPKVKAGDIIEEGAELIDLGETYVKETRDIDKIAKVTGNMIYVEQSAIFAHYILPQKLTPAMKAGTAIQKDAAIMQIGDINISAKHAGRVAAYNESYADKDKQNSTAIALYLELPDKEEDYRLQKFVRSNQGTCINQIPLVDRNEYVTARQPIADGPATDHGELALGYNILVAYMPWEGYNYEDAILLSENLIKQDIYTSIHIEEHQCDARDTKLGPEEVTRDIPNVSEDALTNLDADGIIAIGADVRPGDILVGKVTPKGETELTAEERLLRAIFGEKAREVRDTSLRVPHGESGKIVDVKIFTRENNDEMAPGVNKQVRVYIAQKRKISVGDKMSGRHGNKGVVSQIMRQEDMPFLPDGTPVDIVLNPLGVPSRMNIGQILETHLGMAVRTLGWRIKEDPQGLLAKLRNLGYDADKYGVPKTEDIGLHISTPVFDGARESDVINTIKLAGLDEDGKTVLYDGRTGEPFENRVTVGCVYMLKLHHLVDDKIHARSTGPYSLVTQQPLGGKAQFGGQRFGEMEVWALEAYGASYTLQEILTVKSDDVVGRVKAYEAIVKGNNIPEPGVPESFKVLIKELQSIALDIKVLGVDDKEIIIHDEEEDEIRANRAKAEKLDEPDNPNPPPPPEEPIEPEEPDIDTEIEPTDEEIDFLSKNLDENFEQDLDKLDKFLDKIIPADHEEENYNDNLSRFDDFDDNEDLN